MGLQSEVNANFRRTKIFTFIKNGWNGNWDFDKNPGAEGLNVCIYLFAFDQHDCLGEEEEEIWFSASECHSGPMETNKAGSGSRNSEGYGANRVGCILTEVIRMSR